MSEVDDAVIDALTPLVASLTASLDTLAAIARKLHPPRLDVLIELIGDQDRLLAEAQEQSRQVGWPVHLNALRDQLEEATRLMLSACSGLRDAVASGDGRSAAYRSFARSTLAVEALYPLAAWSPPIGRWFLNPPQRDDAMLQGRLRLARPGTGVRHEYNERGMRGGFSVYVPEYNDGSIPMPLVMALHGGSGHGRQFLWRWIREARGRGLIVVAPTSTGDTWSLQFPRVDVEHVEHVLAEVRARWPIDPDHVLLTGMSDGGTFTQLLGLTESSSFTHLAPIAATFDPVLVEMSDPLRVAGLPIYLVHGAHDWMFPVQLARLANSYLVEAGANVCYREIADLAHTYPAEENERIVDWLLAK